MRVSIKSSVTAAVAIGAAALVLAACGDSDSDSRNAGASTMSGGSGIVSIQSVDGTNVLADSEGRTLYNTEVEKRKIRCIDGCTSFWEPVTASAKQSKAASADLNLKLGVVKRPDGAAQLTFDGLPLYRFTEEGAGQLEGDGFVDDFQGTHFEWAAATTSAGAAPSESNTPDSPSPY